jgi:signal peptidase I
MNGRPPANGVPAPGRYPGQSQLPLDDRTERLPPWRPLPGQPARGLDPVDGPTEVFDRPADLRMAPPGPAAPVRYPPAVPPPPAPVPVRRPGGLPAPRYRAPVPPARYPSQPSGLAPVRPPGRADLPALPHPGRAAVRRKRRRRRLLEWPFLVAFSLLAALLLRTFVVQTFYIPSESMHDTLLEGDRVLVNKLAYHFHDLRRGDVVVFRRPPNIDIADEDLIKRVIALPGERVEGHDRHVYIDNRQLEEPYVQSACRGTADFPPVTVPAGQVFVMGDNRCDSTDSRVFGPIDTGLVVGRAFVIIWPAGRIGWL